MAPFANPEGESGTFSKSLKLSKSSWVLMQEKVLLDTQIHLLVSVF